MNRWLRKSRDTSHLPDNVPIAFSVAQSIFRASRYRSDSIFLVISFFPKSKEKKIPAAASSLAKAQFLCCRITGPFLSSRRKGRFPRSPSPFYFLTCSYSLETLDPESSPPFVKNGPDKHRGDGISRNRCDGPLGFVSAPNDLRGVISGGGLFMLTIYLKHMSHTLISSDEETPNSAVT